MSTLYELTAEYMALLDMMEDADTDPDILADTLEGLNGELENKVRGCCMVIRELEANDEMLTKEIKRMTDNRNVVRNSIQRMKDYIKGNMDALEIKKIDTGLFKVSVAANPPLLEVMDESVIPNEYLIPQAPKVDKTAIKKALKDGKQVTGCYLSQSESLRIR